jgi:hypothetical protein
MDQVTTVSPPSGLKVNSVVLVALKGFRNSSFLSFVLAWGGALVTLP